MPKVSVLVPCFNDEAYLDEALASIAAQTYGDFEVIVSDDASKDFSRAIAEEWARKDPRFRLVRNDHNLGMTENWNRALREARGDYVAKLDADDVWVPKALGSLFDGLKRRPRSIVAFCRAVECGSDLTPIGPWKGEAAFDLAGINPGIYQERPGHFWLKLSFDDRQLWHSCAFLARREDLISLGGWDARWSCASDTDLILRLLETGRPVLHVPVVGVCYRRREGSVSARAAELGWKTIEGILVPLESLARQEAVEAVAAPRLRRNWWRLWSALERLKTVSEPWSRAPGEGDGDLRGIASQLAPPPVRIRAEGLIRDRLHSWRQVLRGAG